MDSPSNREDKELLSGAIDLHVHCSPCLFQRQFNEIEFAKQARDAGYRAFLSKSHHLTNADRVQLVREVVPGVEVFGAVVLNHWMGGLNPEAVETAILFGAKEIWMPTFHAANNIKILGKLPSSQLQKTMEKRSQRNVDGISILNKDGEVIPPVLEILDMIASADIIVGTGHLSVEEVLKLVRAAKNAGVKKILVTHPEWIATRWSINEQIRMADMGAMLEHCADAYAPTAREPVTPAFIADAIRKVGADRCVMATDFGQPNNPNPIEGMKQFMRTMLSYGITEKEIYVMTKENPARLLGLS